MLWEVTLKPSLPVSHAGPAAETLEAARTPRRDSDGSRSNYHPEKGNGSHLLMMHRFQVELP